MVRASHKGTFTTITALPPGARSLRRSWACGRARRSRRTPCRRRWCGPDGAYYISQLTGFPFEKGDANIWRVVPGQAATVYASGLTNLTDLAFAPDGSLYATGIGANSSGAE